MGTNEFIGGFYQAFKEEILAILHKIFWKKEQEGTLCNLFYEVRITLITKPEETIRGKENYRPTFPMNLRHKNL